MHFIEDQIIIKNIINQFRPWLNLSSP